MSFLSRLSRRRRRLALFAGVVVVLGAALAYLVVALDRQREVEELRSMRDSLAFLRSAADSCRTSLAREETRFRRFAARVDSLRSRVAAYESLDDAGVPEAEYQAYLEVFDRYNEAVPEWRARADTLRAHEEACRSLVEGHNLFADSTRLRVLRWQEDDGG